MWLTVVLWAPTSFAMKRTAQTRPCTTSRPWLIHELFQGPVQGRGRAMKPHVCISRCRFQPVSLGKRLFFKLHKAMIQSRRCTTPKKTIAPSSQCQQRSVCHAHHNPVAAAATCRRVRHLLPHRRGASRGERQVGWGVPERNRSPGSACMSGADRGTACYQASSQTRFFYCCRRARTRTTPSS